MSPQGEGLGKDLQLGHASFDNFHCLGEVVQQLLHLEVGRVLSAPELITEMKVQL